MKEDRNVTIVTIAENCVHGAQILDLKLSIQIAWL
jgi:hypothetical protein